MYVFPLWRVNIYSTQVPNECKRLLYSAYVSKYWTRSQFHVKNWYTKTLLLPQLRIVTLLKTTILHVSVWPVGMLRLKQVRLWLTIYFHVVTNVVSVLWLHIYTHTHTVTLVNWYMILYYVYYYLFKINLCVTFFFPHKEAERRKQIFSSWLWKLHAVELRLLQANYARLVRSVKEKNSLTQVRIDFYSKRRFFIPSIKTFLVSN